MLLSRRLVLRRTSHLYVGTFQKIVRKKHALAPAYMAYYYTVWIKVLFDKSIRKHVVHDVLILQRAA